MSCGPDDMIVSTSVPLAVPAACDASPPESMDCGGLTNGVTCDAVGGGAGVAVHDGGVLGPTSRRRKPQLLRSPERSAPGYS